MMLCVCVFVLWLLWECEKWCAAAEAVLFVDVLLIWAELC